MEHFFENVYVNKGLLMVVFEEVCDKYHITLTEMMILLYLKQHQDLNTAKDIVHKLRIAKSHISTSIHNLEIRGFIRGTYDEQNRRTIHLCLCECAYEVIKEGEKYRDMFSSIILKDFTEEETNNLKSYIQKMILNANSYLEKSNNH